MKIVPILYGALSFLAINIGISSYAVAASTFQLTQTSQEISGTDSESGVAFQSSLPTRDHVVIDATIGTKRIHADIDYTLKKLRIRSFSQANGTAISLSAQDILAFQKLRVSLPAVNTGNRHGEALASFVNLMANAPPVALDISSSGPAFTPICNEIGGPGVATYTLGIFRKITTPVTVGPHCYMPPALGRCGAGGGPDGNNFAQRFTRQCLNHDQCCVATMKSPPVCGAVCFDEFLAAAPGFFFAPDCGTTAGKWTDTVLLGIWELSGGDSSGPARAFTGTVKTSTCGTWSVAGTRTGLKTEFKATNPSPSSSCVASVTYTGFYNDCNTAAGTWFNSAGDIGPWSWMRTEQVTSMSSLDNANALPGPAAK